MFRFLATRSNSSKKNFMKQSASCNNVHQQILLEVKFTVRLIQVLFYCYCCWMSLIDMSSMFDFRQTLTVNSNIKTVSVRDFFCTIRKTCRTFNALHFDVRVNKSSFSACVSKIIQETEKYFWANVLLTRRREKDESDDKSLKFWKAKLSFSLYVNLYLNDKREKMM